jgi:hypothetical protein
VEEAVSTVERRSLQDPTGLRREAKKQRNEELFAFASSHLRVFAFAVGPFSVTANIASTMLA